MKAAAEKPFAVIDIGSNSVRMVVYHALARVPMPLFNEKYYCALGRDLAETGKLNPEGMQLAEEALARFALMLERFDVAGVRVIATAAMRDADDGRAFVKRIEKLTGLRIDVIDGTREAELAALGILASMSAPEGLCADLGGGSLELAHIAGGSIKQTTTLPLGALRLAAQYGEDKTARHRATTKALASVPWLESMRGLPCYAIGGSFRSLAKFHARRENYPLKLVHEYRLSNHQIAPLANTLMQTSADALRDLPGISAKRAPVAPIAAQLLQTLTETTEAPEVLFSVAGIREGLLYDELKQKHRKEDPLLASARFLASLAGRHGRYAEELFGWMQPLFADESGAEARLREALCMLSEIAWTIDPNFRAEWAYLRVIQSDMKGLSHRERVMLALALYHRYQLKYKHAFAECALLSEDELTWAQTVGIAASLAFHLSGGQPGNLPQAALNMKHDTPQLRLDDAASALYTDTVAKRLDGLGSSISALSSLRK